MVILQCPAPTPKSPRFVGMPNAEIRVARHEDGRYMWGLSFSTSQGGEGFHPLPKWGRFSASEASATEAAVAELLSRLGQRHWGSNEQIRALRDWAEELQSPVQGGLFA